MNRSWNKAAIVLSLDLAEAYADDVGITIFYSRDLRELIRRRLAQALAATECSIDARSIISDISGAFGKDIVRSIKYWIRFAFPGYSDATRFWLWSVLFEILRQTWEEAEADNVPLGSLRHSWARLRIRDYLSHIYNIRDDIQVLADSVLSEWDMQIEGRSGVHSVRDLIKEVATSRSSQIIWNDLLTYLPAEDMGHLQWWARCRAQCEKMPLRYLNLPRKRHVF